jgi:molybdopterin-guanine dinucleotide biosynthesis protein A
MQKRKITDISGVILAGGANNRFNGKLKAKTVIGGLPIISRIINTIVEIFDEIIIVTNTPEAFEEYSNFKIVRDQFLMVGPLGGIHAGMKASSKMAVFVFAGDMPFIEKNLINSQISHYFKTDCEALIPRSLLNEEPLHAIYSNSILEKLEDFLSVSEEYAIRDFLRGLRVSYLLMPESKEIQKAFTNINTPSDLDAIEKLPGLKNPK